MARGIGWTRRQFLNHPRKLARSPKRARKFDQRSSHTGWAQPCSDTQRWLEALERRILLSGDLAVSVNLAPASANLNDEVTLRWTVQNVGDAPVSSNNGWRDNVYLSDDQTLIPWGMPGMADELLFNLDTASPLTLNPGESYTAEHTFNLSFLKAGSRYLLFQTDANYTVDQQRDNNIAGVAIDLTAPDIDLLVSNPQGPSSSDASTDIHVEVDVTNIGSLPAPGGEWGPWTDSIYLSTDTTLDLEHHGPGGPGMMDLFIGEQQAPIELPLAAGQGYHYAIDIPLPNVAPGDYYLLFVADAWSEQLETNESNNVAFLPITISAPDADFQIDTLNLPTTGTLGGQVLIDYTASNHGSDPAGADWYDTLYLTPDGTLNNAVYVATFDHSDIAPLGAGQSYHVSQQVTIPTNASTGNLQWLLQIDAGNQQSETSDANNSAVGAITIAGPDINLTVSDVQAPAQVSPGDSYYIQFNVNNIGSVNAAANFWYDYIYLSSTGQIDGSEIFLTSSLHTGGLNAGASYPVGRTITIPQDASGDLALLIVADAAHQQAESSEADNVHVHWFQAGAPDLRISSVTAPGSAVWGNQVDVSFTVFNDSANDSSPDGWYDRVYLSNDQTFDGSDLLVGNTQRTGALLAGGSYDVNLSFTTPTNRSGQQYLLFVTDAAGAETESDETNNVLARALTLTAPDLTPTGVTNPATAIPGETVTVGWTVLNQGDGVANGLWQDRLYLSADDQFDPNDTLLTSPYMFSAPPVAPGDSYAFSTAVTLPGSATGNMYLILVTDAGAGLPESNNDNNTVASTIAFETLDLAPQQLEAPAQVNLGEAFDVAWLVQNLGAADADADWFDRLYLSSDAVLDGNDQLLATVNAADVSPLAGGASYPLQTSVTLSNVAAGQWYLLLAADAHNQQLETDETNNVLAQAVTVTAPDLVIDSLDAPATGAWGEQLALQWLLHNVGNGPAGGSWQDYVYLSNDMTLSGDDVYLGYSPVTPAGALEPDQTLSNGVVVTLPTGRTGPQYLLIVANANQSQAESSIANNVFAQPLTLTAPNLTLEQFTAPAAAAVGQTITLTWEVRNTGNAAAASQWWDRLYLSSDAVLDVGDTPVTGFRIDDVQPLAPDGTYTRTLQATLPASAEGSFYLLLQADGTTSQPEADETDNVLARPIDLTAPDLEVTAITAPVSADWGQNIAFSWTVTNTGTGIAHADWLDRVYLSADAVFDGNDTLLTSRSAATESPLAPAAAYTFDGSVTLPGAVSGDVYLLFVTDATGVQPEADENNNVVAHALTIASTDPALLDAHAPSEASIGQTIAVDWTVGNVGAGTLHRNWSDVVYLSTDNLLDGNDVAIGSLWNAGKTPLAPGGQYTQQAQVTIPQQLVGGDYFLIFATVPASGNQPDSNPDNNTIATPLHLSSADLQITTAVAPDTGAWGQWIDVQWAVSNLGPGSAPGSWVDRVYLSTDQTLDGNDTLLSNYYVYNSQPLDAAAGYAVQRNVYLPAAPRGAQYLLFVADATNSQTELEETANNILARPFTLTAADLQVTQLSAPLTGEFGSTLDVQWTVHNAGDGPATGTIIDQIWLSTDPNNLAGARLLHTASHDATATPLAPGADLQRQVEVVLPLDAGLSDGTYYVVLQSDRYNSVREINENDNQASSAIEMSVPQLPDLSVTVVTSPATARAGQPVELTWTLTNNGTAATTGPWTDYIYISADDALSGGDRRVASFRFDGVIAPGQSVQRTQSFLLPLDVSGLRYFVVETDAKGEIYEHALENNNSQASTNPTDIETVFANLIVSDLTPPSEGHSDQQVLVQWQVTNVGNAATSSSAWHDAVYLSLDGTLNGSDVLLGTVANASYLNPNESYSQSLLVTLPTGADGDYQFLVVTDYRDSVEEQDREDDNLTASAPVTIALTPPPDLLVTSIMTPTQAFSGQPVTVSWTVQNVGNGDTVGSLWYDRLYLSQDDVLDGGDRDYGAFSHSGALTSGASYTVSRQVTLPEGISGDWHFIVVTDAYNYVFEHVLENNNTQAAGTPLQVNLTPPADLEVDSLIIPATAIAGHALTVNYHVTNYGSTATTASVWRDEVYLSLDGALDPQTDILLGHHQHNGRLSVDDGYDVSLNLTLPENLAGSYTVFVRTDVNQAGYETDYTNNTLGSTSAVVIANQPANLVITAADAPTTGQAGTVVPVTWTVRNTGVGATPGKPWYDRVYLSADLTLGEGDQLLASVQRTTPLAAGASYSVSRAVTLPWDVAGAFYLLVVTDEGNVIPETGHEDDNLSAALPITISRKNPDLQVTAITAPQTGASGTNLQVSWTVTNEASQRVFNDVWYDAVYLTQNGVIDESSIRVGTVKHTGALAAGAAYDVTTAFTLPASLTGSYTLVVRTDDYGNVVEADESNNATAADDATSVTLSPAADLQVTNITIPAQAVAGQLLNLSWTVHNAGAGAAAGGWDDVVYLSRDMFLERGSDIYLGYVTHPSTLNSDGSYNVGTTLELPAGISGPFYVIVVTDSNNRVYERDQDGNNTAVSDQALDMLLPQPLDLVAGTITIPPSAIPGQDFALTYHVSNAGPNDAIGSWYDALYLSTDDQWDVGDLFFERAQHSGGLDSGETYEQTVTAALPGLLPGTYHVILRTDIRNQLPESDETNNLAASVDQFSASAPTLTLGQAVAGTLPQGRAVFYAVDVAAGQTLRIFLDGASDLSASELYVRLGDMPSRGTFDYRQSEQLAGDCEVIVPTTEAGTYYIMAYSVAANPGDDGYSLLAETIPFSVRAIDPISVGNTGPVTLRFSGAHYERDTTFNLIASNGAVITPTRVLIRDASTAYATYDLTGVAVGAYDVQAIRSDNQIALLEDGVQVTVGAGADFQVAVSGPPAVRPGRQYVFNVVYGNLGDADILAPLLLVNSPTGTPFGSNVAMLDGDQVVQLLARGFDGPAGTLRPGELYSIPIIYTTGVENITFEVHTVFPDDPRLIDWAELNDWLAGMVSGHDLTATQWQQTLAALQSAVGTTYGDWINMLARNARLRLSSGAGQHEISPLAQLEVERALASIGASITGAAVSNDLRVDLSARQVTALNLDTGETFHTTSLEDGSFIFPVVTPGDYELRFDGAIVAGGSNVTVLADTPLTGVQLDLQAGATLSGKVTAAETGLPLQDVVLVIFNDAGQSLSTITDVQGRYRFEGLAPGTYQVATLAAGRALPLQDVVIANTDPMTLNLSTPRGGSLAGQVVLAAGGPTDGTLRVTAQRDDGLGLDSTYFIAGPQPGFSLLNLPPGSYDLHLTLAGYQPVNLFDVVLGLGEAKQLGNINLERAAEVHGAVQSLVPGVEPGEVVVGLFQNGVQVTGTTPDATGDFMFVDLAAGLYQLAIADLPAWPSTVIDVVVTAGEVLTDQDLVIAGGAQVQGVVRLAEDNSLAAGVPVYLRAADGTEHSTITDNAGHYQFFGVGLGAQRVYLTLAGVGSSVDVNVLDIETGDYTANLTMPRPHALTGRVVDAQGNPLAEAIVGLYDGEQLLLETITDTQGQYAFDVVGTGDFIVRVRGVGSNFMPQNVTLGGADLALNDFTAGSAQLTLNLFSGGQPETNAQVMLFERATGLLIDVLSPNDLGQVTFGGLTAGEYRLQVIAGNRGGFTQDLAMTGQNQTLNISLQAARSIAGIVRDGNGQPVAGAQLLLVDPLLLQNRQVAVSAADGSFEFVGVTHSSVDLLVLAAGMQAHVETLGAGASADVQVTLTASTRTLTGRAVDGAGLALARASVVALDASGRPVGLARTDAGGNFTISSATGVVTLKVISEGYQAAQVVGIDLTAGNVALGNLALSAVASARYLGNVANLNLDQRQDPTRDSSAWTYASPGAPGWLRSLVVKPQRRADEVEPATLGAKNCEAGRAAFREVMTQVRRASARWQAVATAGEALSALAWNGLAVVPLDLARAAGQAAALGLAGVKLAAAWGSASAAGWLAGVGSKIAMADTVAALGNAIYSFGSAIQQMAGATSLQGALAAVQKAMELNYGFADIINNAIDLVSKIDGQALGQGFDRYTSTFGIVGILYNIKDILNNFTLPEIRDLLSAMAAAEEAYINAKAAYDQAVEASKAAADVYRNVQCPNPNLPKPRRRDDGGGDDGGGDDGGGGSGGGPATYNPAVVISKDPNDILGPDGFGDERWTAAPATFNYTIRFENDPQLATAPAQQVTITQQLDSTLDWRTFRIDDLGWGDFRLELNADSSFVSQRVDLSETKGYWVDVTGFVDVTTGVASWTLTTLDPATGQRPADPFMGFLPPDDETGIGEGFVSYTIRPRRDAVTGDVVDAEARIVFDINEPIDTPRILNTLDLLAPTSSVTALPASSGSNVAVQWTGSDGAGAGVAAYDIYVRDNQGAYYRWLESTTANEAVFAGLAGHRYDFYSIAIDQVGLREDAPAVFDATTLVEGASNPPSASAAGFTVAEDQPYAGQLAGVDLDNDPLTFAVVTPPTHGLLTVNPDGSFTYQPQRQPTTGFVGNDSFTFTVNDGATTSSPATVSITLTPVNSAPSAVAGGFTVNDGATHAGQLAGADADGDSLIYELVTGPTLGQLTLNPDGSFSYLAPQQSVPAFVSSDSFTFRTNDGMTTSAPTAVNITLTPTLGALGDRVWIDADGDGLQQVGADGAAGVTVQLLDAQGQQVAQTTTDAEGGYLFDRVNPGNYRVQFVLPAGYLFTLANQDADDAADSDADRTTGQTALVTVSAGQTVRTEDAGLLAPAVITGAAWIDSNRDGVHDPGEAALGNVRVYLDANTNGAFDPGETSVLSGNDGAYSFTGLFPGAYVLRAVTPNNYDATAPASGLYGVDLAAGQTVGARDFGYVLQAPATLGGMVWEDLDLDGVRDGGEPGQPGVTVILDTNRNRKLDANEVSTITDANGQYEFGVNPGRYYVFALLGDNWTQTAPAGITRGVHTVTVANGDHPADLDFGGFRPVTLNGFVYEDRDGNATRDGGEAGMKNVTLFADRDGDGVLDRGEESARTAADGSYSLIVAPGDFVLRQVTPRGYVPTEDAHVVQVASGDAPVTLNLGAVQPGVMQGMVFTDTNGNGEYDTREPGQRNAVVFLDANANGQLDEGETRTLTDTRGAYKFEVGPGTYDVYAQLPADQVGSTPQAGGYLNVQVASGAKLAGLDFGAYQRGALAGKVFNDADGDARRDRDETGAPGITVRLFNAVGETIGTEVASTLTNAQGEFTFANLAPGRYFVTEDLPNGIVQTTPAGATQGFFVDVLSGQTASTDSKRRIIDMGNVQEAALRGTVFEDTNANGVRDDGELGLPAVTVFLDLNRNGRLDANEQSQQTDAQGQYEFKSAPGKLAVSVLTPANMLQSLPDTKARGRYDLTVTSGTQFDNLDFGYYRLVNLSGVVYDDVNGNQQRDEGEAGLARVKVFVDRDNDGRLDRDEESATTDANGNYALTAKPGSVRVSETLPRGYVQTEGPTDLTFTSGAVHANVNLGNVKPAKVSGTVFDDANADGVFARTERGIAGAAVWVDVNGNDVRDPNEPQDITDSRGSWDLLLPPGDYTLRTELPANYVLNTPDGAEHNIVGLLGGQTVTGLNYSGYRLATLRGSVFEDLNGSTRRDRNEGPLENITIDLLGAPGTLLENQLVATTQTGADGKFEFANLVPGQYVLRQQTPDGYNQTLPTNQANYNIDLVSGEVEIRDVNRRTLDFANRPALQAAALPTGVLQSLANLWQTGAALLQPVQWTLTNQLPPASSTGAATAVAPRYLPANYTLEEVVLES